MSGSGRRWLVVAALSVCVLAAFMDVTTVSIDLPKIGDQLHASFLSLQLVIFTYLVACAAMMLVVPALGDRYGRRRVLVAGLLLFGAASAAAAWSPDVGALIVCRTLMGVGAAAILPMRVSVTAALFAPPERRRAFGIGTTSVALAMPIGPVLGGALLQAFWWGSVLLINVGVVAIAVPLILWLVPRAGGGQPAARNRLSGLRAFRNPELIWSQTVITLANLSWNGAMFVIPMYLQIAFGFDPIAVGVRLLPFAGLVAVGSLASDRVAARIGGRAVVVAGLVVIAAGFALLSWAVLARSAAMATVALGICGLGGGFPQAPALAAAIAALPPEAVASGGGLINALRHLGGGIGVAAVGLAVAAGFGASGPVSGAPVPTSSLSAGLSAAAAGTSRVLVARAFADGVSVAMLGLAALLLLAAGLAVGLGFQRAHRGG